MSEVGQRTKEDVIDEADTLGLVAIFPEPRELLIDLDEGMVLHPKMEQVIGDNGFIVASKLITISKSGHGSHTYMLLNKYISQSDRIIFQACFGSDPVREVLSMIRLYEGATAVTALFETKLQAARVAKWRKDTAGIRFHGRNDKQESTASGHADLFPY